MLKVKFNRSSFYFTLLFVLATSLVCFLMAITYKQLEKLSENTALVTNSLESSLELEKLYNSLKDVEVERRNYILVKSPTSKVKIKNIIQEIDSNFLKLQHYFVSNPTQKKNLEQLGILIHKKYNIVNTILAKDLNLTTTPELIQSLTAGEKVMNQIHAKMNEMINVENIAYNKRKSDFIFTEKSTPIYVYLLSILSMGILSYAFYQQYKESIEQKKVNKKLQLALAISDQAEKVGNYGVWTYNISKRKFSYSKNIFKIFGYDPETDPKHLHFLEYIHPDYTKDALLKNQMLLDGKDSEPFNVKIIRKDGEVRILNSDRKKIVDDSGQEIYLGITTDITDEVKNKENLDFISQEVLFYNNMSKEAEKIGSFAFWRWVSERNVFHFSDYTKTIFGFKQDHEIKDLNDLIPQVHPEDLEMVQNNIKRMYNLDPNIEQFTTRIFRADTKALSYIRVSNRYFENAEEGNYFLVIFLDITEETLSKENTTEKNRTLELQNQELMAFTYVASHDLQEPLRKIETFLSRLKDKEYESLSDSGKQYIERTLSSASRMRNLIDDLLQFSRTTRSEQIFENADINQLYENSLDSLLPIIEEKNAIITKENFPTLNVIPFQIQQLFTNLIGNSLKYSKSDLPPLINIKCTPVRASQVPNARDNNIEKYYKFTFSDNGIGFDNIYATQIFDLFNRLHGKMDYEGTGIGLAICKKIIENHQGYIEADGIVNEGATITVYLPASNIKKSSKAFL